MTTKKAKKVTPPTDMDAHNEARKDDEGQAPDPVTETTVAVLTTAEVAEALDTDARTLRKFLRSKGSGVTPVGQGRRYQLSAKSVPQLAKRFEGWHAKQAEVDAEQDAPVTDDEDIIWTRDELEEFTVAQLRDMIHDSTGSDAPAKAKKVELIELLLG